MFDKMEGKDGLDVYQNMVVVSGRRISLCYVISAVGRRYTIL